MISHNTSKSNIPLQNHVSSLLIPPPQLTGLAKHSVTPDSSKDSLFRTISKDHRSYHMTSKNNMKRVESALNHTSESFYRQKDFSHLNQNSNSPTSKNSTEISTKFIRLKTPTSSSSNSKLNVKLFNATDMAKLAMLKLKSKKVYKKLDPNVRQTSAINKKSLSLRISSSLPVSDNEEEQTYASLSKIIEGDNSVSTDSKIFSSNKIGSIYQKSPAWKEPQSAGLIRQPKLIGNTKHKTQLPLYLTNTTTISPNHSFSKRPTAHNLNLTIGGNAITSKDKIPLSSAGTPVLKKNRKEEILILQKTKAESKSPLRKEEPPLTTLKKSGSQKSTKLNLNILKHIFSPNNSVQHSKEGDRSPTSHPKSPVDLYRGRNFAFGEAGGHKKSSSNNIKDLQSAVNRLVRTCEQSLEEVCPDSMEKVEKVKKAQEGVLIKLKKFCQNEDPPKTPDSNVESIFIKDKKLSEGKLYLLRSDNEKLKESIRTKKQNVDIYLKKDNIDLNMSSETMSLDDNLESGKEKTNEELKRIVLHQQRVIASLKQREKAMKKALNLIQADGLEIIEFKHPGGESKKEALQADEKTRTYPEIQSLIVDDLTCEEDQNKMIEDIEEKIVVDGEKQVSLIRDSRGESGRLVPIKGTTSSAKSTMDSAAYSTRKQMNTNNRAGNRSLSSQMKNKLMLDFTILGNSQPLPISNKDSNNYNSADKQNINCAAGPDSGQPFGFHEEFMARLDEFSFSWRQAAMNQRKI